MNSFKDTSNNTDQHPEGVDSTKPRSDQLSNTHAEGSNKKVRGRVLNILNGYNEKDVEGRKKELLGAGLSIIQVSDISKSNTRILKLEKHKYWIAVRILMAAKRKKILSLKKLYKLLIGNKSLEELNEEIKKIPLALSKKSKSH